VRRVLALGAAIALAAVVLLGDQPVRIARVEPRICISPCTLRLAVRIERDDANALLRVLVDGTMSYYSEIALAPNSPTLFPLTYKFLPAGEYAISADLVRHAGRSWIAGRATDRLVIASGE
jgi:hypothetical protein